MKKVTKDKILKTLAVIVLPGGIPIFLGYTAYQLYKKKKAEANKETGDNDGSRKVN